MSTASFAPPAGSLLMVIVNALQAAPSGDTVTVSDSKGDTFTAGPHIAGTKAPNSSWFAQLFEPTAPGPMTVTAHQAGSNLGTLQLAVQVLDGAAASQAGAAAGTYDGTTGTAAQTHALSNTQSGSWLYVAAIGDLATSGIGAQLLGWTASQSDPFEWAAQEVLHC